MYLHFYSYHKSDKAMSFHAYYNITLVTFLWNFDTSMPEHKPDAFIEKCK